MALSETLSAPVTAHHTLGGFLLEGAVIVGVGLIALHFAAKTIKAGRDKVKSDLRDIFSL
ncbi:hypothetical protein EXS70_04360 [Candidatus Peribacteria bacterium]|nr:hypothetical protein [Candidatus Peribacteria bacterium]